jgi:cysteine desulfurase
VLFHADAAQAAGKVPLDVNDLGVDLLSLSAHKAHGPKGVGALYVRAGSPAARLVPLVEGGGQERGLRAGTLPVALVVGFGRAAALCLEEGEVERERVRRLRDRLQARLSRELPQAQWNGHPEERLPGALHLSFPRLDSGAVIGALRGIALSASSACASGLHQESHVLRAIGLSRPSIRGSLRFGFGRFTTTDDTDRAAGELVRVVRSML